MSDFAKLLLETAAIDGLMAAFSCDECTHTVRVRNKRTGEVSWRCRECLSPVTEAHHIAMKPNRLTPFVSKLQRQLAANEGKPVTFRRFHV